MRLGAAARPGATVHVLLCATEGGLTVRVENDAPPQLAPSVLTGTHRGLIGLQERAQDLGGHLSAGPTSSGDWAVEVLLP